MIRSSASALLRRRSASSAHGVSAHLHRPGFFVPLAELSTTAVRSFFADGDDDSKGSSYGGNRLGSKNVSNFGFKIVPERTSMVIERFGKFDRTLNSGFHFLIPLVENIAYVWHLKEEAVAIPNQTAITKDNVAINIDGILYVKVIDPVRASYGVENPLYAIVQLAQTTMRSELGKISLDKTFEERDTLNANIVKAINMASGDWGVECLRYEIRDIMPPKSIQVAMEMQAEAERRKRASILDSEGDMESQKNRALGQKTEQVLLSEGTAQSIRLQAEANAKSIELISEAITQNGGDAAVKMKLATQYISAFQAIAKEGNTLVLPANAGDPAAMVAQAVGIFQSMSRGKPAPVDPSGKGTNQPAEVPMPAKESIPEPTLEANGHSQLEAPMQEFVEPVPPHILALNKENYVRLTTPPVKLSKAKQYQ